MHVHLKQRESFRTVAGTLGVSVGREERLLSVGETAVVRPRVPHRFWNAGQVEARFIAVIEPPGLFETHFETMFGLARDGKGNRRGTPNNIWQLGVSLEIADTYLASLPIFAQQIVIGMLAGIGHRLGYQSRYSRYSD
jgi:hypothetical protein